MNTESKFQVMPDLGKEEYEKLKESIAERGVLIPIEKDAETGDILDGFHRMRACEELGIEPPVVERHFESDSERKIHALTLNLARRQLGPVSWAKAFERLLEARGVHTSRGPKKQGANSRTVQEMASEAGVSQSTAERRRNLSRDLEDHPEVAEQVDNGEITPLEGRRRVGKAPGKLDPEPEKRTVGDMLEESAAKDEPVTLPPKKMPAGKAAGFETHMYFKHFRGLTKFDPIEVASAHDDKLEPGHVEEEIGKAQEVADWLQGYVEALQKRTGLRAVD